MSQAMAATWEHREGSELTLRGYRRTGGVADAVNRSAQAAYDALTSAQQDAARLVFTQLTVVTPDGQLARRRCRRTDLHAQGALLAAEIDAVMDIFSAHRLLVLGKDNVEISHDVLCPAWRQLRDWLGDDQLDRALYSQVVTDAQTWDLSGRDSSYLYRPGRLATVDAATARWQPRPPATCRCPPPATRSSAPPIAPRAGQRAAARHDRRAAGPDRPRRQRRGVAVNTAVNASTAARHRPLAPARRGRPASWHQRYADRRRLAVAAWRVSPTSQARSAMTTLLAGQQQTVSCPVIRPVIG